jgi:hypothetical protein
MRRHLTIGLLAAAPALAASIAHSQVAAPAFDANAAAAIQELATKAASQGITLVPQPEGLVVNKRMISYSGPGQNIIGMTADKILAWSQQDLGFGKRE